MKNIFKILSLILAFTAIIQARHWACPNDLRKFMTREEAVAICGTSAYQPTHNSEPINKKSYHSLGEDPYRSAGGIYDNHDDNNLDDDNNDD